MAGASAPGVRFRAVAGWLLLASSGVLAGCAEGVLDTPYKLGGEPGQGGGVGEEPGGGAAPSGKCDPADPAMTSCGEGECQVIVPACDEHGQATACTPGEPAAEQCNGADDDCDGLVDEDCSCTDGAAQPCYSGWAQTKDVGACQSGTQTCAGGSWGACVGEVLPALEICDGVDNNCDGQIDEGNPGGGGSCTTGLSGDCASGLWSCKSGKLSCQPKVQPKPEVCGDAKDNDCNGAVDENCGCAHDRCAQGGPLSASCDGCVAAICKQDPFCCQNGWDAQCVGQVQSVCKLGTCAAQCANAPCSTGKSSTPLKAGCDSPGTCVAVVCALDSYCCSTDWDSICVAAAGTVCGLSCS